DGKNPSAASLRDELASQRDRDTRPVQMVSWDDCRRVLDRYGMVLPTAAQWEMAARAGTTTPWWPGASAPLLAKCENTYEIDGKNAQPPRSPEPDNGRAFGGPSTPVGRYLPNPFGLHDMLGNVSEWCLDISAPRLDAEPRPGRGVRVLADANSREL